MEKLFAKRLRYLFDNKTKPDGTKYTPNDIQARTNNAITASYLWRLLSGKADNPSYQVIRILSDFFDVDAGFFFDDTLLEGSTEVMDLRKRKLAEQLTEKLALRARSLGDEEMRVLANVFELIDQIRKEAQDDQNDTEVS